MNTGHGCGSHVACWALETLPRVPGGLSEAHYLALAEYYAAVKTVVSTGPGDVGGYRRLVGRIQDVAGVCRGDVLEEGDSRRGGRFDVGRVEENGGDVERGRGRSTECVCGAAKDEMCVAPVGGVVGSVDCGSGCADAGGSSVVDACGGAVLENVSVAVDGLGTVGGSHGGATVDDLDAGRDDRRNCGNAEGEQGRVENVRGANWHRNRRARERRRRVKRLAKSSRDVVDGTQGNPGADSVSEFALGLEKSELRVSLEEKWKAENQLAKLKALQRIEVLNARDVQQHVKAARAKDLEATERSLVAVEKAHEQLRRTGNVPAEVGTVETVISSGSISPNSSASLAELRELNAKYEAGQQEIAELRRAVLSLGLDPNDVGKSKDLWTVDSHGEVVEDEIVCGLYGDEYSTINDVYGDSGKVRIVPGYS